MTQDQLKEMIEAGDRSKMDETNKFAKALNECLKVFVEEEREACAKIVDDAEGDYYDDLSALSAKIRARGNQ